MPLKRYPSSRNEGIIWLSLCSQPVAGITYCCRCTLPLLVHVSDVHIHTGTMPVTRRSGIFSRLPPILLDFIATNHDSS